MPGTPSGQADKEQGARHEVLICKGHVLECNGDPPDVDEVSLWQVGDARLHADGFFADCDFGANTDNRMVLRLARRSENEFDGTWRWKGWSGEVKAVLRVVGDRVFGSAVWHDASPESNGRYLFDLEVVERRPDVRD